VPSEQKLKGCVQLFMQSYRASPAIWDHMVLPATETGECSPP